MTLDEERNLSNESNSNRRLGEDLQIWYSVIQLLLSLFSLFIVIYLSIRLKTRAWDSPAKRFSHFFNLYFALATLCFAVGLYEVPYNDILCFSLSLACFLYFTAMYVALLLQVVAPFPPERLKLYARKIHCATFSEVTTHVLLLILVISFSVFFYYKSNILNLYTIYICMGIILFCFVYLSLVFAFVFLIKFLRSHKNKGKSVKYMFLKLFLLFILCIPLVITYILAIHSIQFLWFTFFTILNLIFLCILPISVASLNHPLDIWCCKFCCRRSAGRAPLLPVNDTEGQQTNPISVWDHRNVPSYTATNLPHDMSDCRSDYEELA